MTGRAPDVLDARGRQRIEPAQCLACYGHRESGKTMCPTHWSMFQRFLRDRSLERRYFSNSKRQRLAFLIQWQREELRLARTN